MFSSSFLNKRKSFSVFTVADLCLCSSVFLEDAVFMLSKEILLPCLIQWLVIIIDKRWILQYDEW